MKKLLLALLIGIAGFGLVACDVDIKPPVEDLPPTEEPGEKPDEKPEEFDGYEFLFKNIKTTDGSTITTSASKIDWNKTSQLELSAKDKNINFSARGFALASGTGTGLENEFILKSDKEHTSEIIMEVEDTMKIQLTVHMWFTLSNTQWMELLELQNENGTSVIASGMESVGKTEKTFEIILTKGINTIEYKHSMGQYASQVVFKNIKILEEDFKEIKAPTIDEPEIEDPEIEEKEKYDLNITINEDINDFVIYEIYANGGNKDAKLNHDYIVLYNGTDEDFKLDGLFLQYSSAKAGSKFGTRITALSGTIKTKEYIIVKLVSANLSIGLDFDADLDLSNIDKNTDINLAGGKGKIGITKSHVEGFYEDNKSEFIFYAEYEGTAANNSVVFGIDGKYTKRPLA